MLTRSNRLRSARDIARVYRTGAYGGSSGVLSVKAAASGQSVSRFVVVVGKKIDKRAVVRNRLRRRLVELVRTHLTTVRPGYDIVITVHTNFNDLSAPKLLECLNEAFSRARVF